MKTIRNNLLKLFNNGEVTETMHISAPERIFIQSHSPYPNDGSIYPGDKHNGQGVRDTMIRFSLLYVICTIAILTTSCVVRRDVKVTEYHGPTPLVERLPIKVYAYYSDQFCSREVTDFDDINEIKTQIGEANVELFDYMLTHTFSSVKSIPKFPINAETLVGVDLIIKPKLLKRCM